MARLPVAQIGGVRPATSADRCPGAWTFLRRGVLYLGDRAGTNDRRSPIAGWRACPWRRSEASAPPLALIDAQELGHFFVEESFTWAIGLEPMTVDHQLRDGALARGADRRRPPRH